MRCAGCGGDVEEARHCYVIPTCYKCLPPPPPIPVVPVRQKNLPMKSVNLKYLFLQYCGLTCFGGSEKKECSCLSPQGCQLQAHPDFGKWREEAQTRAYRLMAEHVREKTGLEGPTVYEIIKHELRRHACVREGRHTPPNINPCPECGESWSP